MGSPNPGVRRALVSGLAAAFAITTILTGHALSAEADTSNPTPVSSDALPTVQVNGVVWSQVVIGHTVYAGGSFTGTQPAGAAAGANITPRSNLLAYNVDTGALVTSFAPSLNGQVLSVAASPDGSRLYVAGTFTAVNGVSRSRVAALDPTSGALVTGFAPAVNSSAFAVVATSNAVYVGGAFTASGSTTRTRVAEFGVDGQLMPFDPNVPDNVVRAVVVSPDRSKVLIGGSFTSANGSSSPGKGMAALDALTGGFEPWATGKIIHNGNSSNGTSSSIYSLSTRGDVVYATGQATGTTYQEANLEGMVAMNWGDGSLKWIEDCHGDTYSSIAFDDAVYTASHAHYCKNIGGFDEMTPLAHRALGFSQATTQTLAHNTKQGPGDYQDFGGSPAPSLIDWYPTLSVGTYTGANQAAWSVTAGAGYLLYGGEFVKVNGVRQTGLVRFKGYDDNVAPNTTPSPTASTPTPTPTPTAGTSKPLRVAKPDAVALGATRIGVKWKATSSAKADKVTGYIVSAISASKKSVSKTVSAKARTAVLTGLKKSTTYRVTVTAKNAAGKAKASVTDLVKTKKSGSTLSATKKPGKVAKPAVKARGVHSVRIAWKVASTKGATPVRHYLVRVYRGGKLVKTVTTSASARSLTVKSLKAHTKYTFAVAATSWAGTGSRSSSTSATTRR